MFFLYLLHLKYRILFKEEPKNGQQSPLLTNIRNVNRYVAGSVKNPDRDGSVAQ